jgi:hypothetical protein
MEAINTFQRGSTTRDIERIPKARVRVYCSRQSKGGMRTIDPRVVEFVDSKFKNVRVGCCGKSRSPKPK